MLELELEGAAGGYAGLREIQPGAHTRLARWQPLDDRREQLAHAAPLTGGDRGPGELQHALLPLAVPGRRQAQRLLAERDRLQVARPAPPRSPPPRRVLGHVLVRSPPAGGEVERVPLRLADRVRQRSVHRAPLARERVRERRGGEQRMPGPHAVSVDHEQAGAHRLAHVQAERFRLLQAQVRVQRRRQQQVAFLVGQIRHAHPEELLLRGRTGSRSPDGPTERASRSAKRGLPRVAARDLLQRRHRQLHAEPVRDHRAQIPAPSVGRDRRRERALGQRVLQRRTRALAPGE